VFDTLTFKHSNHWILAKTRKTSHSAVA